MSSDKKAPLTVDIDTDDWSGDDVDDDASFGANESIDGWRRVEKKLEDLRLRRETSEFDFGD